MKEFAQLFAELDQTNKTNAKVELLKNYFLSAEDQDKLWVLALFTHKRPKRQIKTSLLREWVAEAANIPMWLLEETYHMVGDLAETIALLLPSKEEESEQLLHNWIEALKTIGKKEEEEQKAFILNAWDNFNTSERFVFNKLLTGGFRIGVSQKLIVKALAEATEIESNVLAHRIMGNWSPDTTTFEKLIIAPRKEDNLSQPYPFCLAYPLEKPEDLEDTSQWLAEWKWDGIRGQIIVRENQLFVWSRGEELVTEKFPEFSALKEIDESFVLDGEILAFKEEEPLPFGDLQTRIGRKNVTKKILESAPVIFKVYDLLEIDGEDLREKPFEQRRKLLKSFVERNGGFVLKLSECFEFQSIAELAQLREEARAHKAEGLMIKKKESTYEIGRKKGLWWKWKVDPYTVDAVLIYAQKGHGRRAGLFTDYTFAVWKGEELVPIAKAYSGLTDEEFKQVDAFINKNIKERFGPVRTVKPELVFEIGFEGIQQSKRHKSGVALRFPRILRWRTDKKMEEADSIETLMALL